MSKIIHVTAIFVFCFIALAAIGKAFGLFTEFLCIPVWWDIMYQIGKKEL